jgi:transposase
VHQVLFELRESRGRDGPLRVLGDGKGTLLADGYAGYDEVVARNGLVRAGCWAHARRKLKDALDTGAREAAEVLVLVQRLFRIEKALKLRAERDGFGIDELCSLRGRVRCARSVRVVEQIHAVVTDLTGRRATLPKSQLGKALAYLDNQRAELAIFLDDPRIPIHNNATERDVRHLAVGRNNWMIFASRRGGEVGCRLYSLILSCRHAGVDPQAYVEDVLSLVSTTPASQIESLTPWAWALSRAAVAAV